MKALQDKVIWITGALGSLGQSAVRMFLDRGAKIMASDIKPLDHAPQIASLRKQFGECLQYTQADLSEEDQVKTVVVQIDERFGRLDGTYHTVYANVWKPALELSLDEWEYSVRGTLTTTFLVCKHALPLMIRSGGGSIVNTSSILGQIVSPGCLAYGAAKAGVNQLTRVIAADYASRGIRANVLVPGDFRSREVLAVQPDKEKESIAKKTWLGRSGSSEEVNEAASFLLSDASSYVTGALFPVDGGFHQ